MESQLISRLSDYGLAGILLGVFVFFAWGTLKIAAALITAQIAAREKDLEWQRGEMKATREEGKSMMVVQQAIFERTMERIEARFSAAVGDINERIDGLDGRLCDRQPCDIRMRESPPGHGDRR